MAGADTTTRSEEQISLTFEQFRQFARQSGSGAVAGEPTRIPRHITMNAEAMLLPLFDKTIKPFLTKVTALCGSAIQISSPQRLDTGQHFCLRLEMSLRDAAWVECRVTSWELIPEGDCEIHAQFVNTNCPYACGCPLIIFIRSGKKVHCPYAGHKGCVQQKSAGAEFEN